MATLVSTIGHGFWLKFAGRDTATPGRFTTQVVAKFGTCPRLAQETLWPECELAAIIKNFPATSKTGANINSSPGQEYPGYSVRTGPAVIRTGTNINSSPGHETPRYCVRPGLAVVRTRTNINSSPGHETPRYCGRPGPPPRLALIILLKLVPIPLGPPTPQPPARKHCTGGPRA